MDNCNAATSQPRERILARRFARELTKEELWAISGGLLSAGIKGSVQATKLAANSSSVNTCTVCCDCDGGADD